MNSKNPIMKILFFVFCIIYGVFYIAFLPIKLIIKPIFGSIKKWKECKLNENIKNMGYERTSDNEFFYTKNGKKEKLSKEDTQRILRRAKGKSEYIRKEQIEIIKFLRLKGVIKTPFIERPGTKAFFCLIFSFCGVPLLIALVIPLFKFVLETRFFGIDEVGLPWFDLDELIEGLTIFIPYIVMQPMITAYCSPVAIPIGLFFSKSFITDNPNLSDKEKANMNAAMDALIIKSIFDSTKERIHGLSFRIL